MKNLVPLVVVLLAVSLPPTAAAMRMRLVGDRTAPFVECDGDGVYAVNSTYDSNRRRLAGLLLADASGAAGPYYYTADRAVGYWPNRPQANLFCRRRDVDVGTGSGHSAASACTACIASAFLELERACPNRKEASFYSRNCTLEFSEFRIFGTDGILDGGSVLNQLWASGLIFQAIGFGWLFFLLLQEWRSRKRGTMMHSTPLLSGD